MTKLVTIAFVAAVLTGAQTPPPAPAITAYVHIVSPQSSFFASLPNPPTFQPVAFILLSATNVPASPAGTVSRYAIQFHLSDGTTVPWFTDYVSGWTSLQITLQTGQIVSSTTVTITQDVSTATATVVGP
jgi:hypothetical protein